MRTCFKCQKPCADNRRQCNDCKRKRGKADRRPELGQPLTTREIQIAALVAKAKFNKEIAWELRLSEGTVKEYMCRIFVKLGLTSRTELAVRFLTGGVA